MTGHLTTGILVVLAALLVLDVATEGEPIAHDLAAQYPTLQTHSAEARGFLVSNDVALGCGLDLEVSGGTFEPDYCAFEIVVGGPKCDEMAECKPQYDINLESSRPTPDEIMSVSLSNIRDFETGTYRFDPNLGATDFKGRLIDKGAVARHLLRGEVTLGPRGDDTIHVILDVQFANDVAVRGSGLIKLKRVYEP